MILLRRIEAHLKRSGTRPTRLGRQAMGDPRFVFDLRNGRQPRPATIARMLAWIEAEEGRSA